MNEKQVKGYMVKELSTNPSRFDIYDCDEVDATTLAEDTAQSLSLYEGDNIPERVFEIALEVSEQRDWFN